MTRHRTPPTRQRSIDAYWFRKIPNFGDMLTPWLLNQILGVPVRWVRPSRAALVGVGSITHLLPGRFAGTVWGTGKIQATDSPRLERANVLALRGPLSGEAPIYGDPGILVGRFYPAPQPVHAIGVISHFADPLPTQGHRIDIQQPVDVVVRQALTCERIISSSLHGLILADSLGLSHQWVHSSLVKGQGFKFHDYAAAFGLEIEERSWRLTKRSVLHRRQDALVETLVEWYSRTAGSG